MNSLIPLILSFLPALGWGINGVLVAKLSRKIGALTAGFYIQLFALIVTIFLWPLFFSIPVNINWGIIIVIGFLSALTFAVRCFLYIDNFVSLISPILGTWFLVTSILGIIFLHESVNIIKILSTLLVVVGIIALGLNWSSLAGTQISKVKRLIIPSLVFVIGTGLALFLTGVSSKEMGWYFTTLMIRVFMVFFMFLYIIRGVKEKFSKIAVIKSKIFVAIIFFEIISFTSFSLAANLYEVSYVSVIASLSPLVAMIYAKIALDESTNMKQKLGILLTILGVVGLQLS